MGVDVNTLIYQVPGGMLSNLVSQLKQANASDKYEEVLKEIPRVREDFGFPPLVTPTSQIVGTQAVMNVLTGERYKMVPKESKALVKGEYGKTPVEISKDVQDIILKGEAPITCRPADLIEPELESIKEKAKGYMKKDEDALTYAMFPQVAEQFFEKRDNGNLLKEELKEVEKQESKQENQDEIVAAITAAVNVISEEEDVELIVKSFKRVPQTHSTWSLAGRLGKFRF